MIAEPPSRLIDYGRIPISFQVVERIDISHLNTGIGASSLRALPVTAPYLKDYDAIPDQRPSAWVAKWDLRKWWFAAAYLGERRVGGVAVVIDIDEVEGAESPDVAVLWDIRVHPDVRQQGIGRELLAFAEDHARSRGIAWMKAETQDINVAACHFYARGGYELASIDRSAYPQFPDESQLIWQKRLA